VPLPCQLLLSILPLLLLLLLLLLPSFIVKNNT
jgi:hypothetical protein